VLALGASLDFVRSKGRLRNFQPSLKIIPDSVEKKIADRMADRLDISTRTSVRVGSQMAVDVDMANGGSVEDDCTAVA